MELRNLLTDHPTPVLASLAVAVDPGFVFITTDRTNQKRVLTEGRHRGVRLMLGLETVWRRVPIKLLAWESSQQATTQDQQTVEATIVLHWSWAEGQALAAVQYLGEEEAVLRRAFVRALNSLLGQRTGRLALDRSMDAALSQALAAALAPFGIRLHSLALLRLVLIPPAPVAAPVPAPTQRPTQQPAQQACQPIQQPIHPSQVHAQAQPILPVPVSQAPAPADQASQSARVLRASQAPAERAKPKPRRKLQDLPGLWQEEKGVIEAAERGLENVPLSPARELLGSLTLVVGSPIPNQE